MIDERAGRAGTVLALGLALALSLLGAVPVAAAKAATTSPSGGARGVAANSSTGRVYVANYRANTVSVVEK